MSTSNPSAIRLREPHCGPPCFRTRKKTISRRCQAGRYGQFTNLGAGRRIARPEWEANKRPKALQMMNLTADGLAIRTSPSASLSRFSIDEAYLTKASDKKIMTVNLGAAADAGLMQQIADITGGEHFNVPGGASVAVYALDLKAIFGKIASDRPLKLFPIPEPLTHPKPGRLPGSGMFRLIA